MKENTENNFTKFLITLMFGLLVLYAFINVEVFVGIFLIFASLSQWQPFLITLSPWASITGPLAIIISIYSVYLFFKVRTLSFVGWLLSLTIIIFCPLYYFLMEILKKGIAIMAGSEHGISYLFSQWNFYLNILFNLILPTVIIVLLILFKNRFQNENSKISTKGRVVVLIYSIIIIIFGSVVYISQLSKSFEKPYIGYSDAEEVLGVKPLTFVYIPEGYIQNAALKTNDNQGFSIAYTERGDLGDVNSFTVITQSVNSKYKSKNNANDIKEERIILDGEEFTYTSSTKNNRHNIEGERKGIHLSIASANKEVVTKEILINIVKSSQ